jgi:AcrR family transcriptional regulator
MPRTGRRPGRPGTREAVLDAARRLFAERGYDGASVRDIATAAGVDPALVHHYFGAKQELFLSVLGAPVDPAAMVPAVTRGGLAELPERLVSTFLSVWDDPVSGPAAVALLRSSHQSDWTARLLKEFLTTQVLRRALAQVELAPAEAPLRSALVVSQMLGLAVTRYVLALEPLASAPAGTVVAVLAPTIRRYLTEPLPALLLPSEAPANVR